MYRIEINSKSEAPLLESFFQEFSRVGALNYCVVCLRTGQERRLVKNKDFKKFSAAVKIEKHWQHHFICYMCERQAANALKFFRAASFAAAIDTIFAELMYRKQNMKIDIFNRYHFQKVLKKYNLDGNKTNPSDWDNELSDIRKSTQLLETEPLVLDNRGFEENLTPNDLYVIPDDPPDMYGQVTGLAVRSMGNTTYPNHGGQRGGEGNAAPGPPVSNDSIVLGSSEPKISETLVILDDEDENSLDIKIEKVESEALGPTQSTSNKAQPMLKNLLMKPSDPPRPPHLKTPRLVPLETLLEKPKEVFTGDSLLVSGPNGNYVLHPIAIKEGITTIPSLQAKIIDGKLIYDNMQTLIINPGDSLILKDIVSTSSKDVILTTNEQITQTNVCKRSFQMNFEQEIVDNVGRPETDTSNNKKMDETSDDEDVATPSKQAKVLPEVETPTTDKNSRIDWEDKIPMDVISFMDALDPNRDPKLTPKVLSSKVGPQLGSSQKAPNNDVIDLC